MKVRIEKDGGQRWPNVWIVDDDGTTLLHEISKMLCGFTMTIDVTGEVTAHLQIADPFIDANVLAALVTIDDETRKKGSPT